MRRRAGRQAGATLLETLVALLVLAFGMLGILALQTRVLGASQASLERTQADMLGDDVLERLRADRGDALHGVWDTTYDTPASAVSGPGFAAADLRDWKRLVEARLPDGRARIERTAADTVCVSIRWSERGTPAAFTTCSKV